MSICISIHGSGSPLVLFHGWGFDSQIWTSLVPALGRQHQLYLVDLPGFGLTPTMPWDTFKIALLKRLPANFAVAGWSMGGLFATRLAIEEPDQVTHVVNIASSPRFIRDELWPGIDRHTINSFYDFLARDPLQTLQQFMTLQLSGQNVLPGLPKQSPTVDSLRAGLDVLVDWDLRQALAGLHQPVVYMFGRLDAIMPRTIMGVMQKIYPQFTYIMFEKAAHAIFISHPDKFITDLGGFLE